MLLSIDILVLVLTLLLSLLFQSRNSFKLVENITKVGMCVDGKSY
jgi:hypothetical protein